MRKNTLDHCETCNGMIARRSTGRRRKFCSDACRMEARNSRTIVTHGRRQEATGPQSTGEGLSAKIFLTKSVPCKGENGDLFGPIGSAVKWVEVNEVTWKLTDGNTSRTPTSHGQWGGYNTEAALAWVMEVGWPFKKKIGYWYARCGIKTYGPTDLHTAKQTALAFANGATSFPEHGLAMAFDGPVNLHADPEVDAERRKLAATAMTPGRQLTMATLGSL